MKKFLFILLLSLVLFAQEENSDELSEKINRDAKKVGISISASYLMPAGDLKSVSSYGLGGNIYISYYKLSLSHLLFDEYYFSTNLVAGYNKFFEKNSNGYSLQAIPVGLSFSIPFEIEDLFMGFVMNVGYSFNTETIKLPYHGSNTKDSQKFYYSFGPYFAIPYVGSINIQYGSFGNGYKYWGFGFRRFLTNI